MGRSLICLAYYVCISMGYNLLRQIEQQIGRRYDLHNDFNGLSICLICCSLREPERLWATGPKRR